MNRYTVHKPEKNVLLVTFDKVSQGFEQWVMLSSDRHHDNIHCRRDLERKQLEQAVERGALITDFGDLFCAMQGKYDSMDDIRPEDVGEDYLDRIVLHAAESYEPYSKHWLMMAWGNHESRIRKHNGTDLVNNLIFRMNTAYGANIQRGWYGGWVIFRFKIHKTKTYSRTLYYFHGSHGSGGGAPVTRGTIQHSRQAVYAPDADIIVNGHIHQSWILARKRLRVSQKGIPGTDIQWHVRTPGYQDAYGDGSEGWEVEKGLDPRAQGCIWLRFYYSDGRIVDEMTQAVE